MRRATLLASLAVSVLALTAFPAGRADAAKPRTVTAELRGLLARGTIDQAHYDGWLRIYIDARRSHAQLGGARRAALGGVLDNLRDLAAQRRLTSRRAPLVFLTVQRNREWWAGGQPLLQYGQRVTFPGSQLIWQFYPGQGIQVQWLATFGHANALSASTKRTAELTQLVDEALALAVPRAGGLAWESVFVFNSGRPPWVSALTQGTAAQALARSAQRLYRPDLLVAARAGLGPFDVAAPKGVRVPTPAGAYYAQYSYAPSLRILNGFVQAINGLREVARVTGDPRALSLFTAGEAELRAQLPAYDTGAWSLYAAGGNEASLEYHVLARDFLRTLCRRLQDDLAQGIAAPDPAAYCAADERFTSYLREPPSITLRTRLSRAKERRRISFRLDKVSTVTVTVLRGDRVVVQRSARFGRGAQAFDFQPDRAGTIEVRLRAVDLAGNASETEGSVEVLPARRHRR